jgi:hypothetical protein
MNKYGARKVVTADGLRFDSQKEYARWGELQLLERAGRISDLSRQDRYPLHGPNGVKLAVYVCDFTYQEDGQIVIEDSKGVRTAMYRLKRRWLKAEYGIEIRET